MKKNILSAVFSCILALFVAICVIAGALSFRIKDIVCKPGALLTSAEESGFYTELYEEILYKVENLLSITGIEDTAPFTELLTPELVAEQAKYYLENSYTGSAELDTQELKTALEEKVRAYAYSHNIYAAPEAELEQNIRELVDACMADYTQAIKLPMLPKLLSAAANAYDYLYLAAPVLGCVALFFLVFLFFLQRKREDTLYYAALSAATGAVLLLGLTGLAKRYDVVNRLPFEASAMKTLVVDFAQRLLGAVTDLGLIFLVATGVLVLSYGSVHLVRFLRKRKGEKTLDCCVESDTAR